jgi:hypothetical protein
MFAIREAFLEGGSTMYLVLLFAIGAFGVAIAGAAAGGFAERARGRMFGGLALLLAAATLGIGYYGYRHGLAMTQAAVRFADPSMAERLLAQGEKESAHNLTFGLYACVLPALLGAIMLARSAASQN